MNAFREFYNSTEDTTMVIKVPKEYQKKRLEVIIIPAEDSDYKSEIFSLMDKISDKAQKNGLNEEKLRQLLNE
ncbi:MAG: hypothetical protein U0V04_02465 [Spirosomataceae bacterium]|jgi:hypothetical protein